MGNKKFQKNADGSKFRDKNGYTRYSRDGGKTVYGENHKLLTGVKKFNKK